MVIAENLVINVVNEHNNLEILACGIKNVVFVFTRTPTQVCFIVVSIRTKRSEYIKCKRCGFNFTASCLHCVLYEHKFSTEISVCICISFCNIAFKLGVNYLKN